MPDSAYDVAIIGTGFGASVAATTLAGKNKKVLMLERGAWWFTPERALPDYIQTQNQANPSNQPVQYWARPDHNLGLVDFLSVVRTNATLGWLQRAWNKVSSFFTSEPEPQPLYRYNMFPEIHIVTASGVGGGSLIYSNVTLEPFFDGQRYPVMEGWPLQVTPADYDAARTWMDKNRGKRSRVVTRFPVPQDVMKRVVDPNLPESELQALRYVHLGKSFALRHAARNLQGPWRSKMANGWEPLDLAVFDYDGNPPSGANEPVNAAKNKGFCERQGRCFLGCLPGARHTLNKTLVEHALKDPASGVTLKSLVEVDYISAGVNGGYDLHYHDLRDDSERVVNANKVILAAGCLGSTEILLRSRTHGSLTFSDKLGSRFSSNGDFAGFVVVPRDFTNPVYPIYPTRGPINTGHVTFQDGKLHFTIEDGAIPPLFSGVIGAALNVLRKGVEIESFLGKMKGAWSSKTVPDLKPFLPQFPDPSNPRSYETEHELVMDIFFFNAMGTDDARGKFDLDDSGNLTLGFSGGKLADQPVFQKTEEILRAMAKAMSGDFVPFPLLEGFLDRKIVTVHPLGGCPMGGSSTEGAVNTQGQVFNTKSTSSTVHKNLYVMDGSIVPGPLAVNPTLTIVALALKIAENL